MYTGGLLGDERPRQCSLRYAACSLYLYHCMLTKVRYVSIAPRIRCRYDWSKSTSENYRNKSNTDFAGKYIKERKMLDYSWHCNISRARQKWQDEVIDSVVKKVSPQSNPWIVYTCGPMGAGKGYCLTWMSQHGYVGHNAARAASVLFPCCVSTAVYNSDAA